MNTHPLYALNNAGDLRESSIHLLNFRWLTALRWAAVIGQTLAIVVVQWFMQLALPLIPLLSIVALEFLLNLFATAASNRRHHMREPELAAWVALDLVAFTGLLYFTGGPSNPFSFFYIVHVAMAALTLQPRYAWGLVALSMISYGTLFTWNVPLSEAATQWDLHLHGVWIAYGLAASCVVYFLQRARRAIREREQELSAQRQVTEQAERLSSLATLAAGAAHELANPLGTIAVVAKELANELQQSGQSSALEDIALVRSQVERCRKILARMAHTAGEAPGESDAWLDLQELLTGATAELPERRRIVTRIAPNLLHVQVRCPKEALAQALRVLIDNALDASEGPITLSAKRVAQGLVISVADNGPGIDANILQRVFDPFFTTKPTGRGMGLGLFLARNVITDLQGELSLSSDFGRGTVARVQLPKERFRSKPTSTALA